MSLRIRSGNVERYLLASTTTPPYWSWMLGGWLPSDDREQAIAFAQMTFAEATHLCDSLRSSEPGWTWLHVIPVSSLSVQPSIRSVPIDL